LYGPDYIKTLTPLRISPFSSVGGTMPSHEEKSQAGEESSSLELNKETLQNLDVEPTAAEDVKGGTYNYYGTRSIYYGGSNVAIGTVKPPPPPPTGASI
jgi:hypothetical protein